MLKIYRNIAIFCADRRARLRKHDPKEEAERENAQPTAAVYRG